MAKACDGDRTNAVLAVARYDFTRRGLKQLLRPLSSSSVASSWRTD
jgi:hypothetical protein